MARSKFTQQQIEELRKNPYVVDVDEKRIIYSDGFKQRFIEEYMCNKMPSQIFREAGFDVIALGTKRIERASSRWRESFRSGTLIAENDGGLLKGERVESSCMETEMQLSEGMELNRIRKLLKQSEKNYEYQLRIIDRLKEENRVLKKREKSGR